jgi:hypothetical protein
MRFLEVTMKTKPISAVLVATSALLAAPAFATSGYGPAPFYNAGVGAPSSQRGPSAQTVMAEQYKPADTRSNDAAVGGTVESPSESSGKRFRHSIDDLYRGH